MAAGTGRSSPQAGRGLAGTRAALSPGRPRELRGSSQRSWSSSEGGKGLRLAEKVLALGGRRGAAVR